MFSKLHKRVRSLLGEILGCQIKEEINVKSLFPSYPAGGHRYDIVISSYNLIVECHGKQHERPVSFGEKDINQVANSFAWIQHRDRRKEEVARENGWGYVVIWEDDLPKEDDKAKQVLKHKILQAINEIEE